ncbi:hypothetical protein MOQ72_34075 [Saccharopolyspora sp. K220]|uniref:hypothetical protein n=1 Tax=Saccharopolyspora soli TaxID=2926618 RepID=UPI001F584B44|nr:hypothetical protein [Saccharopolyspora soli]MCI2422467.1 hypothetical protein [Saccharopolyspora soli]
MATHPHVPNEEPPNSRGVAQWELGLRLRQVMVEKHEVPADRLRIELLPTGTSFVIDEQEKAEQGPLEVEVQD